MMTRHWFGSLILLFATCGAFIAYTTYQNASETAERGKLTEELQDFILPPMVPASNSTSPVPLKNLRIARYSIETRLDPLFAAEGVDTEELTRSLEKMRATGEMVVTDFNYHGGERRTVEEMLPPGQFLYALTQLEQLRQDVVERPNEQNIWYYNDQLQKIIRAYIADLRSYKRGLADFSEKERAAQLNYPSGFTTINTITERLNTLEKEAQAVELERKQRFRCFEGTLHTCTSLAERLQKLATVKESDRVGASIDTHPLIGLQDAMVLRDIAKARLLDQDTTNPGERIVELTGSSCIPAEKSVYYYVFKRAGVGGAPITTIVPLNDALLYDVRTAPTRATPFYEKVREQGLAYVYQNTANLYFCPDAGSMFTRILTLTSIESKVRMDPLFAGRDVPPEFRALQTLERTIIQERLTSERNLLAYLNGIRGVLGTYGERGLFTDVVGENRVLHAEALLREWDGKMSHFEQAIANAAEANRSGLLVLDVDISMRILNRFLVSRTYPSLFFLPFNASVTTAPVSFFDQNKAIPLSSFGLVSYNSELKGTLGYNAMIAMMRREREVRAAIEAEMERNRGSH